jgi:hypothetical protein
MSMICHSFASFRAVRGQFWGNVTVPATENIPERGNIGRHAAVHVKSDSLISGHGIGKVGRSSALAR